MEFWSLSKIKLSEYTISGPFFETNFMKINFIYNLITALGFSAMFTFQLDNIWGKHCQHPIAVMEVVLEKSFLIVIFAHHCDLSRGVH